jgi:hypothetical protein
MPAGRDVERLSPDAVMANCRSGISRSIRSSRPFMAVMIASRLSWLADGERVWALLLLEFE